jgi:hypothetical protein
VNYVCGNQQGWERETIDILGGGKSARIFGFRNLTLNGAGRSRKSSSLQPELGQKAMLDAMIAQFSRAKGAIDHTESFIVATQALLATHRSIQEQRVVLMNTHFPYDLT